MVGHAIQITGYSISSQEGFFTMKVVKIISNPYSIPLSLIVLSLSPFCNYCVCAEASIRAEEMIVSHNDIHLSGTLTLPPGEGAFPTVILISGSGPQNRDWDFDWNGEYLMGRRVANDLATSGIAVFRYDDRGVGQSTGEGEDIRELSQDVACILERLRKNPAIGKIGLCGHSLGAEVALRTAVDCPSIEFLILLSSPFITGAEIMRAQAQEMPDMYRSSKEQTNEDAIRAGVEFVQCIAANPPSDASRTKAIALFEKIFRYHLSNSSEEERRKVGDVEKRIREDAINLVEHFLSPSSQFFLHYNPVDDLKKIKCPVAALFGEGDQHVKRSVNLKPLLDGVRESSIRDFTLKVVPEINHFYTASPYRSKGEMYPGVTQFMSQWILNSI
jgi:uncharacterized protein